MRVEARCRLWKQENSEGECVKIRKIPLTA